MRLSAMDPKAAVAFFPADHHFSDDDAFIGHIDSAYSAVAFLPELVALLGVPPETPEVEYGWIEPRIPLGGSVPNSVCRVSRFWEKPHRSLAVELTERGCLWNSFVMVGHVRSLLNLIRRALPRMVEAFESIRSLIATESGNVALFELYRAIPARSFSHDVLSVQPTSPCFGPSVSAGAILGNLAVSAPFLSAPRLLALKRGTRCLSSSEFTFL
jgi:mannose-1-phosphate guanylyltransferase